MPNAIPTASLTSPPANDIAASPPSGRAAHPRRTAMPIALAVSTPNPISTQENTMKAALTLETTRTRPTLTVVPNVPVHSNTRSNAHLNAETPEGALRPPVEALEVTPLRASQVEHVAAQEIEFFFATNAHGDDKRDGALQARATIASWISELDIRDQEALALYYEPEPWPESILDEGFDYETGYALVLSRSATSWRPHGRRRYGAEQAANEQLCAAVRKHGPSALRYLTRRAEWDFAAALRAYAKVRGRAPSAVPASRPQELASLFAGLDFASHAAFDRASGASEGA
jgi:hypothetical protein